MIFLRIGVPMLMLAAGLYTVKHVKERATKVFCFLFYLVIAIIAARFIPS
jgi:hypothetical protein